MKARMLASNGSFRQILLSKAHHPYLVSGLATLVLHLIDLLDDSFSLPPGTLLGSFAVVAVLCNAVPRVRKSNNPTVSALLAALTEVVSVARQDNRRRDQIILALNRAGLSLRKIAEHTDMSYSTVREIILHTEPEEVILRSPRDLPPYRQPVPHPAGFPAWANDLRAALVEVAGTSTRPPGFDIIAAGIHQFLDHLEHNETLYRNEVERVISAGAEFAAWRIATYGFDPYAPRRAVVMAGLTSLCEEALSNIPPPETP
jgi:hypothetical protein